MEVTSSLRMEEGQLEASSLPSEVWHSEVTMAVVGEPPAAVEEKETAEETNLETIPEIIEPLSILDVLRISAILEDTTDQLSILNYIMPVQYERGQSISMKKSKEFNFERKNLEKLSDAPKTSKISSPLLPKEETKLPEIRQESRSANEFNKMQDLVFRQSTRPTIMSTETLKKIQVDRQFFSDIIMETMQELQQSGTFTSLLEALGKEKKNKMHFYDNIAREEKGRKQIKSLQKQLLNVKRERQAEVQNRNEYIAHLKDQLQEMRAKTNLENRYMKRNTELQISQTQKKCNRTEELLLEEIEKIRLKTEEENRIHTEIETFLRREQQCLSALPGGRAHPSSAVKCCHTSSGLQDPVISTENLGSHFNSDITRDLSQPTQESNQNLFEDAGAPLTNIFLNAFVQECLLGKCLTEARYSTVFSNRFVVHTDSL
ncbi:dynein regulatory complex protein 9 isoform X2 [Suricata suricatta]|uniref:dynein regulatory complex protein 9 isoform X2 n=1 Tax=Suricata suricatta TaxID=37032 RepID=UPI0011557B4C|nr:dynein regulatory complex protein 9 isoform X2 [Suricata suricatta]